MQASLGLACAQATTLCTQVIGKSRPRPRAGRVIEQRLPPPGPWSEPPPDVAFSSLFCFFVSLSFLLVRLALKLRSHHLHPPRLCCFAVFLIQINVPPPPHGRTMGCASSTTATSGKPTGANASAADTPSEPPQENHRSSATSTAAASGAAPQGDAAASAAGKPLKLPLSRLPHQPRRDRLVALSCSAWRVIESI